MFSLKTMTKLEDLTVPHRGPALVVSSPTSSGSFSGQFLYLTDGTDSSTGGVFTYFFWVLLQVGFMVLHVYYLRREQAPALVVYSHTSSGSFSRQALWSGMFDYPKDRGRLKHWWCLHLLLLGPSPGRIHGPPMFSTSRRGQAPILVVSSFTELFPQQVLLQASLAVFIFIFHKNGSGTGTVTCFHLGTPSNQLKDGSMEHPSLLSLGLALSI